MQLPLLLLRLMMILPLDESTGDSVSGDLIHLTLVTDAVAAAAAGDDDDRTLRLLLPPPLRPVEMAGINLRMTKMMTSELRRQRMLMTMNADGEEMKEVAAAAEANYRDCADDDGDWLVRVEEMCAGDDAATGEM